jgi:DNA-binding ferritin-like protein
MEELASILMHSRTQAHVFHLGVSGPGAFAAHKALQKYYKEIVELVDGLVESYQGKHGLIKFRPVMGLDNNCDGSNIVSYFDKLIAIVETLRKVPNLADSFIQNEIDNVTNLLYSTKYKLVNLQ